MDINIITFDSVPHSAYLDSDIAYKRYRTLSEDDDVVGNYGIITLPIQDVSQSGVELDAESRCPECGETEPVLHCEQCGHNWHHLTNKSSRQDITKPLKVKVQTKKLTRWKPSNFPAAD